MHSTVQTYRRISALTIRECDSIAIQSLISCWGDALKVPRVLVVNESSTVRKTIEACPQWQGFEVTVAGGGTSSIGEWNSTLPGRAPAVLAGIPGDTFAD